MTADKHNPNDISNRPGDAMLRELADGWRRMVALHGPQAQVPMYALALATLVEELIELRKMPRA